MPTAKLFNMAGENIGEIELSEAVFGVEPNKSVLHDSVKNHLANLRQGTQSALTRSEVSGGGIKPWRQKGTGRARQGSTRSPQWTHGGVVFAPKPRDYRLSVNKKLKRVAICSALSSKVAKHHAVSVLRGTSDIVHRPPSSAVACAITIFLVVVTFQVTTDAYHESRSLVVAAPSRGSESHGKHDMLVESHDACLIVESHHWQVNLTGFRALVNSQANTRINGGILDGLVDGTHQ